MPSRVSRGSVAGWESVVLETSELRVSVLPEKGADIYELVDVRTGTDVLFKGPWGLQPPSSPPLWRKPASRRRPNRNTRR